MIASDASTPLWRAVDEAVSAFEAEGDNRRVILVLSDGKDSGPISFRQRFVSQVEVIERARQRRDDLRDRHAQPRPTAQATGPGARRPSRR
ncbi:MAG: hypothetical protein H0V80_07510 [Acidobacteria bacterium]|nr:hypothetical protein [Acidobacteriota bacterium]